MEKKIKMNSLCNQILEHISNFVLILNLYDHQKNKLSNKALSQGITSISAWEKALFEQLYWLQDHREEVLLNLASLRKGWPTGCQDLEELLNGLNWLKSHQEEIVSSIEEVQKKERVDEQEMARILPIEILSKLDSFK